MTFMVNGTTPLTHCPHKCPSHPEDWIHTALDMPKLRLVPLSPLLSYRSTVLPQPFHDDPADQIIVATAQEENATILTKDDRILAYQNAKSLWSFMHGESGGAS